MPPRRHQLLLLASALSAAVPVAFGLIRALTTGDDFRYLWMAGAALLGVAAVMVFRRRPAGERGIPMGRGLAAAGVGTASAAATALLQGATAASGVAIVSVAFGIFSGASGVFASLARSARGHERAR